jgi:hypothetical protein
MAGWLLLRIPRAEGATSMSGADDKGNVARAAMISEVCDAIVATGATPEMLIFPLDGRHGLAGYVLDEATKRGWEFARHVPAGHEELLFDRDGADAGSNLSADEATALLEQLGSAMGEAWNDDEIGESMGIGRQALTLCLRHFGAWHAYTFWILSNYFQAAAGTGADKNITEACNVVEYMLAQPRPNSVPGAGSAAAKLAELTQRVAGVGNEALAMRLLESARTLT